MRASFALAVAAFAVAASPNPVRAAAAAGPTVIMAKMVFGAAPLNLTVGQTLTFQNADVFEHTATAMGEFDLDLKPGQSGSVVLKHVGTIQVACRFTRP